VTRRSGGLRSAVVGCLSCAVLLAVAGCGKRNVVEGTVRDEKNMPVACRVVVCKHESGQMCNKMYEGAPCKLQPTELVAETRNGVFRLEDVPPMDRTSLGYAVVVLTGTNVVGQAPFFVWPKDPHPPHQGFNMGFGNKGAVVNIVLKPRATPSEEPTVTAPAQSAAPESPSAGKPAGE
jgi:hypothetical protein